MKILLYGNGASGNHGCEAIVRGTIGLLGKDTNSFLIQSDQPLEDTHYGLGTLATIYPAKTKCKKDIRFLSAYAKLKLTGNYTDLDGLCYLPGIRSVRRTTDVALSVGGDNYCYGGTELYAYLNRAYQREGIKTVLWGCSIEPEVVNQYNVAEDLKRYNLIVARESITYDAVKQAQNNTILAPDPAFFMKATVCNLNQDVHGKNVIGINSSPMIIANEKNVGMAYENYKRLIHYILRETDAVVALIPHVVWSSNDDRTVLRQLYRDFNEDPRLVLVEDHTAPELKYLISRCSFFVGARTHATIAAYSACVPTLVVGYSVKARGIARDLFGTEDGYVLPVQELRSPEQLSTAFVNLYDRKAEIQTHLSQKLPEYLETADAAVNALKGLVSH